jgi:hypothetical protein
VLFFLYYVILNRILIKREEKESMRGEGERDERGL